ncbi:MAG: LD-carboxypeptidase [Bacteroidales bacterium]
MELITPPFLKKGDTIAIVAPARKVARNDVEPAIKLFEKWGFKVLLGENIYKSYNQFAGTDTERASDFQSMLENPNVKAIICARGGYGTIRILEHINLRALQRDPKWIVGYSDVTVLHSILNSWFMVETLHGIMPYNFTKNAEDNEATSSLKLVLLGESPAYTAAPHSHNKTGNASGLFVGGNLSILYSLSGTDADINTEGKILFIEDLDEYLYHIDRMMMNLKRSGKLRNIAGLVVGGMTDMNDNSTPFGKEAIDIIKEAVDEYDYPVCFNFPAGHVEQNLTLIMGRSAELTVNEGGVSLVFTPAACKI